VECAGKVSLFYKCGGSTHFVGHKGVHSHVEMMARIHDIQQAVKNGRNLKAGETTCDTFVETIFKPWALKNIPGSAQDVLSRWWLYWSERLGSLPLRVVTEHHVNQAVSAIRSGGRAVKGGGHTVGGANRIAMAGRTIFRAARDLQYIDTSPADGIRNLHEDPPSPRALTADELERLGGAIDNSNDHDRMVEVTLRTGCRIGEIQTLKPEHIDRAAGVIHLPATKSGVAQTVAADKRTFEILDMQLASRRAGNPYVFQGAGARPAAYRLDLLHRLFDKAGLPQSGYHVLRKTWATQAMSMGVDLLTISRHLRHQSVRTTERHYIATPRDRLRTASEAVGAMFSTRLQASRRPQLLPSMRSVLIGCTFEVASRQSHHAAPDQGRDQVPEERRRDTQRVQQADGLRPAARCPVAGHLHPHLVRDPLDQGLDAARLGEGIPGLIAGHGPVGRHVLAARRPIGRQ
jgi:integrase